MKNNNILTNVISFAIIVGLGLSTYSIIEEPYDIFTAIFVVLAGLGIICISNEQIENDKKEDK